MPSIILFLINFLSRRKLLWLRMPIYFQDNQIIEGYKVFFFCWCQSSLDNNVIPRFRNSQRSRRNWMRRESSFWKGKKKYRSLKRNEIIRGWVCIITFIPNNTSNKSHLLPRRHYLYVGKETTFSIVRLAEDTTSHFLAPDLFISASWRVATRDFVQSI